MITSSLESGGSMDTAVRNIASDGPGISRDLFGKAVSLTDTKGSGVLVDSLRDVLNGLPAQAAGYRRAVSMCISASESSDPTECSKILRDAADSALESVRMVGESYSSSLSSPIPIVFGLGIMVPMILMSLMPMLSIGGMFGADSLNSGMVMTVTTVVIPSGILAMCLWMRSRNPFREERNWRYGWECAIPLIISIPLAVIHQILGLEPESVFLFSVAPAALVTLMYTYVPRREGKRLEDCVGSMMDSVMDMGNMMLSGENFERASVYSLISRDQCAHVGIALEREFDMCRGNPVKAISNAVGPISTEMSDSLRDVYICSERDVEDAGRLAVTLGRQYQNRNVTMEELEAKLKSITDMMFATASFFAPMVLGLSVAMLEPLSGMIGGPDLGGTSTALGMYLVELSALIALLTTSLGRTGGPTEVVWRFCMMCPVSLLIFAICGQVNL